MAITLTTTYNPGSTNGGYVYLSVVKPNTVAAIGTVKNEIKVVEF